MDNTFIEITIENLYKKFHDFDYVLKGIDLHIYSKKITYILGRSGQGKSLLLRHILGLIKPDQGKIYYKKENIFDMSYSQLIEMRKNFGMLFQNAALFDEMTVYENVAFPLQEHSRLPLEQIEQKVLKVLNNLGILGEKNKYPNTLSGGQKKRAALARAIISEPSILLYDEPTTGLDPVMRVTVDELILKMNRELALTSVVISHDVTSALLLADYIAFLSEGKIIFFGSPEDFRASQHPFIQNFLTAEVVLQKSTRSENEKAFFDKE